MIIGSHVSMSAPGYLLGAMQETVGYHANACMIYRRAAEHAPCPGGKAASAGSA